MFVFFFLLFLFNLNRSSIVLILLLFFSLSINGKHIFHFYLDALLVFILVSLCLAESRFFIEFTQWMTTTILFFVLVGKLTPLPLSQINTYCKVGSFSNSFFSALCDCYLHCFRLSHQRLLFDVVMLLYVTWCFVRFLSFLYLHLSTHSLTPPPFFNKLFFFQFSST